MADAVENHPVCPETGAPVHRDTRPMTIAYKGETATFDMPGWYCDESDESIHDGPDMKVSDRTLTELKAKVEGRLAPKAVRRIRKRLKLTQKDESGDILVSHAVTSALLLLDRDPSGLEVLQEKDKATHAARVG